jgi:hypothetical protein
MSDHLKAVNYRINKSKDECDGIVPLRTITLIAPGVITVVGN